jgi:hypothetical protein
MPTESARDIILKHRDRMASLNCAWGTVPSADPYNFLSDDGVKFNTRAEAVAYNLSLRARDQGNRAYEITQNRLFRRA